MFFRPQHLHFTGIGGIGMSGIAEVLLNLGYEISGSDLKLSATTERLAAMGARIFEGHDAANVAGARALVVSSAVDEQNPEVQEARRLQIPVIPRGELLAELMRLKYGIAVAGSHGKTTTTSMTATILNYAGLDPTVVVGGRPGPWAAPTPASGRSDFLVVESDESDGSFLKLAPIIAVVTNIDREHLDHYPSLDAIRAAFIEFVNKVPFYGAAIVCLDDANVQGILPAIRAAPSPTAPPRRPTWRPARSPAARSPAISACAAATPTWAVSTCGIPGRHNVLNATAAVAVALELEVKPDAIREALADVQRRGPPLPDARQGARHHRGRRLRPSPHRDPRHAGRRAGCAASGASTCCSSRTATPAPSPDGRVRALLPPGRQRLRHGYLRRLRKAHRGRHRARRWWSASASSGIAAWSTSARWIAAWRPCRPRRADGDLVLTLGAGSVWQAGDKVLARLRARQEHGARWRKDATAKIERRPAGGSGWALGRWRFGAGLMRLHRPWAAACALRRLRR